MEEAILGLGVFLLIAILVGISLAGIFLGVLGGALPAVLMGRPMLVVIGAVTGFVGIWPAMLFMAIIGFGISGMDDPDDVSTLDEAVFLVGFTGITVLGSLGFTTVVGYMVKRHLVARDTVADYQPDAPSDS